MNGAPNDPKEAPMADRLDADAARGPHSPHRQAWDLVPWVVAGVAGEAQRRFVHEHARECAECRAEIEFHRAVRDGMAGSAPSQSTAAERATESATESATGSTTGSTTGSATGSAAENSAWAQMQMRLEAEAALAPPTGDVPPPGLAPAPGRILPGTLRWLVAAVVVQAVGLAALAGVLAFRAGAEPSFEALGDGPGAAAVQHGAGVRLVLAPELTLGEIRTRLAASGWQLAEVSADGSRFVALPAGAAAAPREQVLALWRMQPGTLLAEPMPRDVGPPGPAAR
jgi:hypothetical protein